MTTRCQTRHLRRGSILPLVLLLVFVLAGLGLGLRRLVGGAVRVTDGTLAGERANLLARSALAEVWTAVEQQAHDGTTEVGRRLQAELAVGDDGAFELSFVPDATRALAAENGDEASVSEVVLAVRRQRRIWAPLRHEKHLFCSLRVTARVERPSLRRTVTRVLEQWRELKVVYPSPPAPLADTTLFVLLPKHLERYERSYRALQIMLDTSLQRLEDEISDEYHRSISLPRPYAGAPDDGIYRAYPYYRYPPFPYTAEYDGTCPQNVAEFLARNPYPWPADQAVDLCPLEHCFEFDRCCLDNYLLSTEPEITARDAVLRFPAITEDAEDDPSVQALRRHLEDLERLSSTPGGVVATEEVDELQARIEALASAEPLARFERSLRERLSEYSRKFPCVAETSMEAFGANFLSPYLAADLDGTVTVDECRRWTVAHRCTHAFPDEAAFYAEVGPKGGEVFLDGIYYVDGPVTVDFAYRGRGTVMGRNRVTIERCERVDPSDGRALCTVLSFCQIDDGASWQSIDLQCDPVAGVVALTGMVKNLANHSIYGSLAVGVLEGEPLEADENGARHDWRIVHDPALSIVADDGVGVRHERCRVVGSPTIVGTVTERTGD